MEMERPPTVGRLVPGALTDLLLDNGLFAVGLAMNWAVFVFSTCAK